MSRHVRSEFGRTEFGNVRSAGEERRIVEVPAIEGKSSADDGTSGDVSKVVVVVVDTRDGHEEADGEGHQADDGSPHVAAALLGKDAEIGGQPQGHVAHGGEAGGGVAGGKALVAIVDVVGGGGGLLDDGVVVRPVLASRQLERLRGQQRQRQRLQQPQHRVVEVVGRAPPKLGRQEDEQRSNQTDQG